MDPQQFPPLPGQSDQPSQINQTEPPHVNNPLAVMQPDEQIICEIKRHPIGMLGIYLASGSILVILAVLAFIVAPNIFGSDNRTQVVAGAGLFFIITAAVVLAFVFIANIIYWGNRWVVTSDSLTQISQTGLFSKQSAQLSLGNLEDVTVEQNGILAQLFKFGVLKAETAGERSKFMFPFCPNPNYYAQKILAAREVFEQVHHGGKQVPYVAPVAVPVNPASPSPAPETQEPNGQNTQYQLGQTPPNYSAPPEPSQPLTYPGQPPAGPAAAPSPNGYSDDSDINTNPN